MLSKTAGWALLALLLVQGASAQAPAGESSITSVPSGGFSEKGGPPASEGLIRGSKYGYPTVGLNTPSAFTFVYYSPSGQVFTQLGNYTSWQCAPSLGPGGYIATFTGRNYAYDFSYENVTSCELGMIDRRAGTWKFVDKPASQGCPMSLSGPDLYTVTILQPMPEDTKGFASVSSSFCGA
ncbi:hypothetical protein ABPG75_011991 [Micractinium tetrahymenae]